MKNGFSLIEALIALGIIGLCAAILPAFYSRLHQHSESDSALDNLHAALLLARAKALSEGDYVVICGQSDSGNCSEIFSHTLMVFSDKNRNGLLDGQETLDQIISLPDSISVRLKTFSGKPFIYFQPQGTTEGGNGSLLFCHKNNDDHFARKIAWTRAGRIKISSPGKDGFHYYKNEKVSCAG